jgi:hypothetical protein
MSMLCAHTGAIELTELPEQSPDARICCFDARSTQRHGNLCGELRRGISVSEPPPTRASAQISISRL